MKNIIIIKHDETRFISVPIGQRVGGLAPKTYPTYEHWLAREGWIFNPGVARRRSRPLKLRIEAKSF